MSSPDPNLLLPREVPREGQIPISVYQRIAATTDRLPDKTLRSPLLGVFGEIGTVLSVMKKHNREGPLFSNYREGIIEELGDVIWYVSLTASRAKIDLARVMSHLNHDLRSWDSAVPDAALTFEDVQARAATREDLTPILFQLAGRAGALLNDQYSGALDHNRDALSGHLLGILRSVVDCANAAQVRLDAAVRANLLKTFGRWPEARIYPSRLDAAYPRSEQLPSKLAVLIEEREVGGRKYVFQSCRDINVGDRLSDNNVEKDDYRFHDVFHWAYAVHLNWSPVIRSLLRLKRKSNPETDENQDGARALIVEEGIANMVFGHGFHLQKEFSAKQGVDFDLLKSIQRLVRGLEVERCALWQWEQAILDGFSIFRQLREHRRGIVDVDLDAHTMVFQKVTA